MPGFDHRDQRGTVIHLLVHAESPPAGRHEFPSQHDQPVATVGLDAYPDGGLSRVRLIGHLTPQARRAAGYRWFNSLPAPQALQCLTAAGLDPAIAADLTTRRPLGEGNTAISHPVLTSMLEG